MTRLTKTNKKPRHIYVQVKEITSIAVDGNTTFIEVDIPVITDELGRTYVNRTAHIEIPTLDLIQTFNATWVNHAVGKLKSWLNSVIK